MGFFNGLFGIASTGMATTANLQMARETNLTNKQIADEANKTQMDMWHEQQQHDLDMWNRENQYNSPSAQVARLQNAGLNPLMLAGGNMSGNAVGNAGGQTPPSLAVPTMQAPQVDVLALSQAAKNAAETANIQSDTSSKDLFNDQVKQMMLEGYNPELIKAQIANEQFKQAKVSTKYSEQHLQGQLKKLFSDIDVNNATIKYRKELCKKVQADTKGVELTNDFNAQQFPQQLRMLSEQIQSTIVKRQNDTNLANAQINAANAAANASNASASLSEAQAGLVEEQKNTQFEQTIKEQFENGLRKFGINPNDKNVPFFANIAVGLATGKLQDAQVAEYFDLLQHAERVGWDKIAKSNANLTKFQMQGSPTGMFGSGVNVQQLMQLLVGVLKDSPKGSASVTYPE